MQAKKEGVGGDLVRELMLAAIAEQTKRQAAPASGRGAGQMSQALGTMGVRAPLGVRRRATCSTKET